MAERQEGETTKKAYEAPTVLNTYTKQALEDLIRPHGSVPGYGGCGCGCGG
jgi:hypothetical protein